MVMGYNSCLRGHEFESPCRTLDGHFFTFICCKNCNIYLKRQKINKKHIFPSSEHVHEGRADDPGAEQDRDALRRLRKPRFR